MARDLILGESQRNWSRGTNILVNPVTAPPPVTYNPATEALRQAMDFDSSVKIRKEGKGVMATKIWKWG
jgi:hypothetical protein